MLKAILAIFALAAVTVFPPPSLAGAETLEKRVALVIGDGDYAAAPLTTAAADAALIAQTLQAAGFDVSGARDLDEDGLRHAFRDFLEKVRSSGPDTVAFIYFAGYGVQFEGDNFLAPVDLARDDDAPSRSVRVADLLRQINDLHPKLGIVTLDAARSGPFLISGQAPAGGLALVDPGRNIVLAFNAAPGTVAPEETGPYGVYAKTLAATMREGGLPLNDMFARVRLRVSDLTKGAQLPWNSIGVETSFVFFEKSPEAPPAAASAAQNAAILEKPIRSLGPKDAYLAALARDTLPAYEEFEKAYPDDPMAKRVRAIVAARREALIWRKARHDDTPEAYWTYLRDYAHGPHARDARRRLQALNAALEPPRSFAAISYDVPPPPPEEYAYVDRPVVVFDEYDLPPPPPVPEDLAPPPPPAFVDLPAPVVITERHALPVPRYVPLPMWIEPPKHIAPPAKTNLIYANLHHEVDLDRETHRVTIRNQRGEAVTPERGPGGTAVPATAAAIAPPLPPSLTKMLAQPAQPAAPGEGRSAAPPQGALQNAKPSRGRSVTPERTPKGPAPGAEAPSHAAAPPQERQAPRGVEARPTGALAPPSAAKTPEPHALTAPSGTPGRVGQRPNAQIPGRVAPQQKSTAEKPREQNGPAAAHERRRAQPAPQTGRATAAAPQGPNAGARAGRAARIAPVGQPQEHRSAVHRPEASQPRLGRHRSAPEQARAQVGPGASGRTPREGRSLLRPASPAYAPPHRPPLRNARPDRPDRAAAPNRSAQPAGVPRGFAPPEHTRPPESRSVSAPSPASQRINPGAGAAPWSQSGSPHAGQPRQPAGHVQEPSVRRR